MNNSMPYRGPVFRSLLATATLIAVACGVANASPCKVDGTPCRTNQSCCGTNGHNGLCVNSQPPGKRPAGVCCTPTTCEEQGATCGTIPDGTCPLPDLSCGSCTLPETCGGGGDANQCGCTPTTCAAEGISCGTISDGCGGTLECGTAACGTLIVAKQITDNTNNVTDWSFAGSGVGMPDPIDVTVGVDYTISSLAPGAITRTVVETVPAGYELTNLVCSLLVAGAGGSQFAVSASTPVPVQAGGIVTATITNLAAGATVRCEFINHPLAM